MCGHISKKKDCRLVKYMTVLHRGVCHRTSTPHKSGNKRKTKYVLKWIYTYYAQAERPASHPSEFLTLQSPTTIFVDTVPLYKRCIRRNIYVAMLYRSTYSRSVRITPDREGPDRESKISIVGLKTQRKHRKRQVKNSSNVCACILDCVLIV